MSSSVSVNDVVLNVAPTMKCSPFWSRIATSYVSCHYERSNMCFISIYARRQARYSFNFNMCTHLTLIFDFLVAWHRQAITWLERGDDNSLRRNLSTSLQYMKLLAQKDCCVCW